MNPLGKLTEEPGDSVAYRRSRRSEVQLAKEATNEVKHRTPLLPTTVYLDILKVIYPEEYEGKRPAEIRDEAVALIKKDLEGGIFL